MATLTARQIAGLAVNAGFKGNDLITAVAVALAESSGNPNAHNTNSSTGDNSYGLWQINMIGSMGPSRRRQFDISDNNDLFNPTTNAQAAYKLYRARGGSFADWSAYKSGAYKSKLNTAKAGVKENGGAAVAIGTVNPNDKTDVQIGPLGLDLPKMPDIGGSITEAFNTFGQNIFKAGMNAGGLLIAVILLILGVVILLRQPLTNAAKTVAGVAGATSPTGKVANVAGKAAKVGQAIS